jgi:hypothetical protein
MEAMARAVTGPQAWLVHGKILNTIRQCEEDANTLSPGYACVAPKGSAMGCFPPLGRQNQPISIRFSESHLRPVPCS